MKSFRRLAAFVGLLTSFATAGEFQVVRTADTVRILDGADLVSIVHYGEVPKPFLYPVFAPGGVPLTRGYPMERLEGEANDHPHHRSLWFAHGAVDGVDFWAEGNAMGRIVQQELTRADAGPAGAVVSTRNAWTERGGRIVCFDDRAVHFSAGDGFRVIEFAITLRPADGEITFGDTKEGTMACRVHPDLRLKPDPKRGVRAVHGRILNSEGKEGDAAWGQRARWIHYQGTVDGHPAGVAILDHPGNLRHPTWWHARNYGLVAANPFGAHDFGSGPPGAGNYVLKPGGELRLVYRFLLHAGNRSPAWIESQWNAFAAPDGGGDNASTETP